MSSELSLFNEFNTPVEVTGTTDWMALPKEQLLQEATAYHGSLERQEQQIDAVIRFAKEQKKNVIYEKGELYKFMKGSMTYDEWLAWLKEIDVSRSTANECIQLATEYREELTADTVGSRLSRNQLFAIHRSGEGHKILARLGSEDVKPTQDTINAEIEAAKQRAQRAELELEAKQKELDLFKDHAKFRERNREQIHVSQILAFKESEDKFKREKEEAEQKLKALREQTVNGLMSPEVKAQIEKLEAELKERTEHNKRLFKKTEELGAELDEQKDANKARHEQEMYEHRINDRVKKTTEEWGKCSVTLLGQLPSPIESQVVTGNNWALLDHATDMAQKIIDAVKQAKISKDAVFLNSEVPDAN